MKRSIGVAMLLAAAALGCHSSPKVDSVRPALESQLVDGQSTRVELMKRFGVPTGSFEGGKILTYQFNGDGGAYAPTVRWVFVPNSGERMAQWGPDPVSVVLVFDSQNVLVRHAVVSVR